MLKVTPWSLAPFLHHVRHLESVSKGVVERSNLVVVGQVVVHLPKVVWSR